jgi:2-polyprenyl-3-methyl-5-hydroxy-6-metoxy-1,4-benzoquinol methylase
MTDNNAETKLGVQVDSTHYTTSNYCKPDRFATYSYQINEILETGAKNVLEIGPGNGVVAYVLRQAGIHVDTVDHDPALKPDFVASVLKLPFPPNSYDAVMCWQVLEHLPWEHFRPTMQRISNIAKNTILISLPHVVPRHFFIEYKFPLLKQRLLTINMPVKNVQMSFNGQHYWEIGKGVSEKDVVLIFEELNLKVDRSYRIPEKKYAHVFCLSKYSNEKQ